MCFGTNCPYCRKAHIASHDCEATGNHIGMRSIVVGWGVVELTDPPPPPRVFDTEARQRAYEKAIGPGPQRRKAEFHQSYGIACALAHAGAPC